MAEEPEGKAAAVDVIQDCAGGIRGANPLAGDGAAGAGLPADVVVGLETVDGQLLHFYPDLRELLSFKPSVLPYAAGTVQKFSAWHEKTPFAIGR